MGLPPTARSTDRRRRVLLHHRLPRRHRGQPARRAGVLGPADTPYPSRAGQRHQRHLRLAVPSGPHARSDGEQLAGTVCILLPDWADLPDTTPTAAVEIPQPQPIGIDLFAGAGGFSCGFKQAGWHVIAGQQIRDVEAPPTTPPASGPYADGVLAPEAGRWRPAPPTPRALPRPARRPSAGPKLKRGSQPNGIRPVRVTLHGSVRRSPAFGPPAETRPHRRRESAACSAARPAKGSPAPAAAQTSDPCFKARRVRVHADRLRDHRAASA